MEKASKVMYTIANIFNWVVVICSIVTIIMSIVAMNGALPANFSNLNLGSGTLAGSIVTLAFAIVAIILVRVAKDSRSGIGWDILFIIIGVFELNIFYILGGIFGCCAKK